MRAALIVAAVIPLSMLVGFHRHARLRRLRQPDEPGRHRLRHDRGRRRGDDGKLRAPPARRRRPRTPRRFRSSRFAGRRTRWPVPSSSPWPSSSPSICRSCSCRAWKDACSGPWRSPSARRCSGSLVLASDSGSRRRHAVALRKGAKEHRRELVSSASRALSRALQAVIGRRWLTVVGGRHRDGGRTRLAGLHRHRIHAAPGRRLAC